MLTRKMKSFDVFKQAVGIPCGNTNFIICSVFSSIPFFCFLVFFEIILQRVCFQTSMLLQLRPKPYLYYYYYPDYGPYGKMTMFVFHIIQLCFLYLITYQLLGFLNIITVVPMASRIYAEKKPVSFSDMMTCKTSLKGPFITSLLVHLLSTTFILVIELFVINCCHMVMSIELHDYIDIFLTIIRGVGFIALLVKFLEWSAVWNMALVISILEGKYGIEALKFSAYINKNCSQQGLILMFVFFVWGVIVRLPCIFYGFDDVVGSLLFTSLYTCLICLGNWMKWLTCVVYFYHCKKWTLENKVDDEEVGRDVKT